MALRISIGQYYPHTSPIHRLDPRAKVLAALVIMVSVFFMRTPVQLLLGYALTALVIALARVPARSVWSSVRPLLAVLAFLSIFNLFVTTSGTTLLTLGALRITTDGVWFAILYTLRLAIAVVFGALVLLTTTPTELTDAFDATVGSLSRIGLPGHELAMVFSLMLRFIPTLADEAGAIVDAQTSRGGALGEGSFAHRVRAIGPVLVALLASSMRHANNLARALDARCYEGGAGRTHWHPLKMHAADWLSLAITAAYVTVLLLV